MLVSDQVSALAASPPNTDPSDLRVKGSGLGRRSFPVARTYEKLGVSSRAEVAVALEVRR